MGAHALALVQDAPFDAFARSRERFDRLLEKVGSTAALGLNHREVEDLVTGEGRELMRQLVQDHLTLRGPGLCVATEPVVDDEGVTHTHVRMHARALETVFGKVHVERAGYGGRGLASLHPLDAELNLPKERYSHGVRRHLALEATRGSFDEAVASVARHTGAHVPKRQAEELVVRAATDFDLFYQLREPMEASTKQSEILALTTDGKGIVMRPSDLRLQTRRAAAKTSHKLKRRLSKGEKRCRKRMAQVAAVYTIAPFVRRPEDFIAELRDGDVPTKKRPRPEQKRVWASVEKSTEQVVAEIFDEALRRDPERKKRWVALVDANLTQLDNLRSQAKLHDVELTVIVDIIHVLDYVWKAAWAFHSEGSSEAEKWVDERLLEILRGRASWVAAGMRRSATLRNLSDKERTAVDACADYMLNQAPYLRYDQYLADGLPIGSGVIEGACRHLVKDRMDITGARWTVRGAEAVLRLRALRSSGDFESYWLFHETMEQVRNHEMAYADNVPTVEHPRRPRPVFPSSRRADDRPVPGLRVVT